MLGVGLGVRMIAAAYPAPPVRAPPGKPLLPSSLRRRSSSWWFSNGNAHERDSATATSRAARRRWWSDPEPNQQDYGYSSLEEEYDYDYDDEDEDEDEAAFPGLGGAGELFDESWFSKVFKTYGFLLPVMLVSMLAATGLKAFLLAMAIPLGQSAISFLIDTIWGRRRSNRDDRSRRPFQEEEEDYPEDTTDFATGGRGNRYTSSYYEGRKRRQDSYQSWVSNDFADAASGAAADEDNSTNSSSSEGEDNKSSVNFGGWDELLNKSNVDTQEKRRRRSSFSGGNADYSKRQRPAVNGEEDMDNAAADRGAGQGLGAPPARMRMRRRRGMPRMTGLGSTRYRQVPILMRLLVAVFPFLGSWFRLL